MVLGGCRVTAENDETPRTDLGNPKLESIDPDLVDQLQKQGIYPMSIGTDGETWSISVFRPDQRALAAIRELLGTDLVVIEEKESFFIRGQITDINQDDNSRIQIFIENSDASDKACISMADYTKIQRTIIHQGREVTEILGYSDLEVGQTVEVWVVGYILATVPPKASAAIINIIE